MKISKLWEEYKRSGSELTFTEWFYSVTGEQNFDDPNHTIQTVNLPKQISNTVDGDDSYEKDY